MRTTVDLITRVAVIDWEEKYKFDDKDIKRAEYLSSVDVTAEGSEELGALKEKSAKATLNLNLITFMSDKVQSNTMSGAEWLRIAGTIGGLQEQLKGKTKLLKEVLTVPEPKPLAVVETKEKPDEEPRKSD